MTDKPATIQPLVQSDHKLALFLVGKAQYEGLTLANRQAYTHPFTLAIWVLLSLLLVQYMNYWPSSHGALNLLRFLKPLPAFGAMAVPIMFLIDWNNRPHFEDRVQKALRQEELQNATEYYNKSPESAFWVLKYGDKLIGFIAMDASDAKRTQKAIIRHLYVEVEYRKTGIQHDLLNHALAYAFEKNPNLRLIEGTDAPVLTPYIHEAYERAGFLPSTEYEPVGIRGFWRYYTTVLEKANWKRLENYVS